TAALHPPAGRVVLLSKLEETIVVNDQRYDLSSNQYLGAVHPHGYTLLDEFRLDPWPVFRFIVAGVVIEKSLFMVHGQNTTIVEYRVSGPGSQTAHLEVRPLIAFRDYHALTHENGALDSHIEEHHPGLISVRPYPDYPNLYFTHDADGLNSRGYWYKNF